MQTDKTIYATHPVTAEVKALVNRHGARIIDARFAPEGARIMDGQTGDPVEDQGDAVDPTPEPTPEPVPEPDAAQPEAAQTARKGKAPAQE